MQIVETLVILLAAVTTAAAGGVYLGFSAMVMPALHHSPDAAPTMNRINERATRSSFMIFFLGSALTCVAAGILVVARVPEPAAVLVLAGAVAGVAAFFVTAAVNVPLNNRLAAAPDAAGFSAIEAAWRRANSIRAWISVAGAVALGAGLVV